MEEGYALTEVRVSSRDAGSLVRDLERDAPLLQFGDDALLRVKEAVARGRERALEGGLVRGCARERASALDEGRFFREYFAPGVPVVVEMDDGSVPSHWVDRHSAADPLRYIRSLAGGETVGVKINPSSDFEGIDRVRDDDTGHVKLPSFVREALDDPDLVVTRPAHRDMPLSEFLDALAAPSPPFGLAANATIYIEYFSLKQLPQLTPDVSRIAPPSWAKFMAKRVSHVNAWIGDGSATGKLHFDEYDNIMTMIGGTKRWWLHPPGDGSLYEGHIREAHFSINQETGSFERRLSDSTSMVMSPIDLKNSTNWTSRFPRFRKDRGFECVVKEGEAIFVPAFWWHEVKSEPVSPQVRANVAVNLWADPLFTKEFPCNDCPIQITNRYDDLVRQNFIQGGEKKKE